jgi:predicted DNA-binding antitoxin AbrB/MazE fold protein
MKTVHAIYENGVFRPVEPVDLPDQTPVEFEPRVVGEIKSEPVGAVAKRKLTASDLLQSGLVGMWAGRTDIADIREFARRLREQAQTRGQAP